MTENRTNEQAYECLKDRFQEELDLGGDAGTLVASLSSWVEDEPELAAALVAAQGAAPQAVNVEKLLTVIGVALDVTEADVRGEIEASIRREVSQWLEQGDDVVLPSSTVDEDALAEVINAALAKWEGDEPSEVFVARAVAEWLAGNRKNDADV